MSQTIVIYGPQGCGKTLNAPALARHFGLASWCDWEPGEQIPRAGMLLLCTDYDRHHVHRAAPELRQVPFAEACAMARITRPLPNRGHSLRHRQRGFVEAVAGVFACVVILLAAGALSAWSCSNRWADSGMKSRWNWGAGCQVQRANGTWVPDKMVREVTP